LRQTLCGGKELVGLKTRDPGQSEKRISLCQGDHVVWIRIDTKVGWKKIFHNKRIAEFCKVSDGVDVLTKICAIFQAQSVASGRNALPNLSRLIYVWVLILDVKAF